MLLPTASSSACGANTVSLPFVSAGMRPSSEVWRPRTGRSQTHFYTCAVRRSRGYRLRMASTGRILSRSPYILRSRTPSTRQAMRRSKGARDADTTASKVGKAFHENWGICQSTQKAQEIRFVGGVRQLMSRFTQGTDLGQKRDLFIGYHIRHIRLRAGHWLSVTAERTHACGQLFRSFGVIRGNHPTRFLQDRPIHRSAIGM